MGLLVIHGAQAGGFSPISIYGGITNGIVAKAGLPLNEIATIAGELRRQSRRRGPAVLRARRPQAAASERAMVPGSRHRGCPHVEIAGRADRACRPTATPRPRP